MFVLKRKKDNFYIGIQKSGSFCICPKNAKQFTQEDIDKFKNKTEYIIEEINDFS